MLGKFKRLNLFLVIIIIFIGVSSSFLLVHNIDITGMVVLTGIDTNNQQALNLDDLTNLSITKQEAINALSKGNSIILEMQKNNLSTVYIEDVMTEARRIFEQAEYAEVLRNNETNLTLKNEAEQALKLVDWKNIDFGDVVHYVDYIKLRREQAYYILDQISVNEINIDSAKKQGLGVGLAVNFLNQAKNSFSQDRYNEASDFILKLKQSIEDARSQNTVVNTFARNSKNFFQRFWRELIGILVLSIIIILIFYRQIVRYFLRKQIRKMEIEEKVLLNLMKKIQTERYKNKTLSGLVYNLKINKYRERLNSIQQELPVLESRLHPKRKFNLRK